MQRRYGRRVGLRDADCGGEERRRWRRPRDIPRTPTIHGTAIYSLREYESDGDTS